jgi:hypothetical protein
MKFLNLLIFLFLASCAMTAQNSENNTDNKKATLVVIMASPEAVKIDQLLTKKKDVDIKHDTVSMAATLYLPEVEVTKPGKSTAEKPGYPDALNGNICLLVHVHSGTLKDYSEAHWSTRLEVDGHVVKDAMKISALDLISTNGVSPVAGELTIQGCTTGTFSTVNKVSYTIKNQAHKVLARFDWAKPWPTSAKPAK